MHKFTQIVASAARMVELLPIDSTGAEKGDCHLAPDETEFDRHLIIMSHPTPSGSGVQVVAPVLSER
jgi:hypothetical protein